MRNREIDLSLSASLIDSRILKDKSRELPKTRTPAIPRTRKAKLQLSILRKVKRVKNLLLGPVPLPQPQDQHEYQYFKTNKQPQITLSNLSLIIFTPVLVWMHIKVASSYAIPIVQYLFVSVFVAFIYNLIAIVRAYQLMPYLPNKDHDTQLKIICVLNVVALFISIFVGWNGSGGMVFAVIWQFLRGNRGIFYMIIFGVIIGGSITMEKSITLIKLIEFIPGLLYGYISAQLYTLRQSSPYAIANQILLLMTLCLPFGYIFSLVIVPSLKQWLIMILSGFSLLFMVLMSIKLMQNQRVSIVMGITSGIIVIATSTFIGVSDYVAFLMITLSILILLKLEYLDSD